MRSSLNRKSWSKLSFESSQNLTASRRRGIAGDEVLVSKLTGTLETVLAAYKTILSKQKYLAGEELTLADLYHLPYGTLIKTLGFAEVFARYPCLNAWFDGFSERESWLKTTSS
jgi:glutathione S-transferase